MRLTLNQRIIQFAILSLTTLIFLITTVPLGIAQLPAPELANDSSRLPEDVTRIGGTEIAPVDFQGQTLFKIASPAVFDRSDSQQLIPVEQRAQRIEDNLDFIVSLNQTRFTEDNRDYNTVYDPETFQVQVAQLNEETILDATDAYRSKPQNIMTVTSRDAEYNGLTKEALAQEWRDLLQTVLVDTLEARSPDALWRQILFSLKLLPLLLLMSGVLWFVRRRLTKRKQLLQTRQERETNNPENFTPSRTGEEVTAQRRFEFLTSLKKRYDIAQGINIIDFFRWLIAWLQLVLWITGIALIVDGWPFIELTLKDFLTIPFRVILVWFIAGLLNRLVNIAISRAAEFWGSRQAKSAEEVQRRSLRITTLVTVTKGLKTFLIYLIAIVSILDLIGFNTTSLLAFGAVIGFAISLASKNLIQDFVNGFIILLEDQYAIGDVIILDGVGGFVENLTLRSTQLRNGEGRLIVIPNSTISRVENMTRTWSRIDHTIEVSVNSDINKALRVIEEVAQTLYHEPDWGSRLVEPPQVLGIDEVSHAGVLIRTWLKTQPLQQWAVGREFRLRLKNAFDKHHIQIGIPQQQVWHIYPSSNDNDKKTAQLSMGG